MRSLLSVAEQPVYSPPPLAVRLLALLLETVALLASTTLSLTLLRAVPSKHNPPPKAAVAPGPVAVALLLLNLDRRTLQALLRSVEESQKRPPP
jgi:hypothetical protein